MTGRDADPDRDGAEDLHPRSTPFLAVLGVLAVLTVAGLVALGVWQVNRLGWKLDLIERIEARVSAQPVAPPEDWFDVTRERDEYTRVTVSGRFLHDRETLVQAVTTLGGGFWVLTPFESERGYTVLVNRGFVPPELRDPDTRAEAQIASATEVTGLLRMSEPGGGFLRRNDPAAGRWYSRDAEAIALAQRIGPVAPFFIDADATPNPGGFPVGGLTVLSFSNNHLSYALTWFALAAGVVAAAGYLFLHEWRLRQNQARFDRARNGRAPADPRPFDRH